MHRFAFGVELVLFASFSFLPICIPMWIYSSSNLRELEMEIDKIQGGDAN